MKLGKYSFGTGDRFGLQGTAQLKANSKNYRRHRVNIPKIIFRV